MSDDDLSIPDFLRRAPGKKRVMVTVENKRPAILLASESPPPPDKKTEARPPRTDKRAAVLMGELEGLLDDVCYRGAEQFSTYSLMQQREIGIVGARAVADHFRPRLEELRAVKPGCDKQLWEGYSRLKREDINRIVDLVGSIVDDADRYVVNNNVARRSPRKHKSRSALRQVRDMRFLRGYGDLKLTSVDPTRVVGASTFWTYDVKRRMLSMYVTNSRTGLEVRGTTIQRFDKEASVSKLLRKPAEVLDVVLNASRTLAPKITNDIKTKGSCPTGRTNESTILLRVI